MNYIDIMIIMYVGFSCFQGYRRGFIKTLFDTVGVLISFFLSRQFHYIVEEFLINNTKVLTRVHDFFERNLSERLMNSFEDSMQIPAELKNILSNIISTGGISQADSFAVFVDNISIILVRSISFIVTFLVIYALLLAVSNLINVIFKLPLLNLTNRLFGAGTGLLKSFIVLYIVFALGSPLIGFLQNNTLAKSILNSESSIIFYDNNIILNYLSYKGFYNN